MFVTFICIYFELAQSKDENKMFVENNLGAGSIRIHLMQ